MKSKATVMFMIVILLAACGPRTGPTPAGTLPPISTENLPALSSPVPSETSTTPPMPVSTVEPTPTSQALSGEAEIEIEDFAFNAASVTIKVGTTVKWSNKDDVLHDIKGDDGSWGSAPLNKGDDFFFTFSQAGTYTYHCSFHPSMKGTIVVVSS